MVQRFDASGVALGGEILVNQITAGSQYEGKVDVFSDGSFVVVWESKDADVVKKWDVYARRFEADGKTVKELRDLARSQGLTGYSALKKAELVDRLVASKPRAARKPAAGKATAKKPSARKPAVAKTCKPRLRSPRLMLPWAALRLANNCFCVFSIHLR